VLPQARRVQAMLRDAGVRVHLDDRDQHQPGFKYADWEMRGAPVRLELGPKDIEKSQVLLARRDTREKIGVPIDGLAPRILELLNDVQQTLFARALAFREEHTQEAGNYDAFKQAMDGRPGFVLAPWCGSAACEAQIKTDTQATIRNIPMNAPGANGSCVRCDLPAQFVVRFAKSY